MAPQENASQESKKRVFNFFPKYYKVIKKPEKCMIITNTVNYLFVDMYAIWKRKFNFKLIFVSLFLEIFREDVKSSFAVEVNLEGLCFSLNEIDDF